MHDIMISYSSLDKPVADAICNRLESEGIRVWIAPRDIIGGESFVSAIQNGIKNCSLVVFVLSKHSNRSNWVPKELERGVSYGKIIIPFIIEPVTPLSSDIEFCISSHHWLDAMTPPLENNIIKLASTIKLLLKSISESSPEKPSFATSSLLGEIYHLANRWMENDHAYFVIEGLSDEIKSILCNTPKHLEIEDENVLLFMTIASLHYGGNWIYWQKKIRNHDVMSRQLLELLKIEYVRPRLRTLFALQFCDKKSIEKNLSEVNPESLAPVIKLFDQYVFPQQVQKYLELLADSHTSEYSEKAQKVINEIRKYGTNPEASDDFRGLPLVE